MPQQPTFDVQGALAAMADYPVMLRRLGVIRVIEVDLAGSGIDPADAGPVTVKAKPTWATRLPDAQVDRPAVTVPAYLSPNRFSLFADGRVDATASRLSVTELDTDSAGMRLLDLARQVVNAERENAAAAAKNPPELPPVSLPNRLSLPSLRNAGICVAQQSRAVDLRKRLVSGKDLVSTSDDKSVDDARHAVLGHVLDVWDDRTGRWHSLCARRGSYRLPGGVTFTHDDEGPISMAATARDQAAADDTLYLHQSLVRWTGWSLVAPRPGQPVITEDEGRVPSAPAGPALPGFSVAFTAKPGSLPRLRFGVGYRFQLRIVNAAGHVEPLQPTSADFSRAVPAGSAPPAKYLRFEPISSPVVFAQAPMTEGESLETLVIRPDPWPGGIIGSILAPILGTGSIRHLAPPKVNQQLCEEHGGFDNAQGVPDPGRYSLIAQRDAADLATVGTADPGRAGQRYYSGTALPVTWLGDPISRGFALAGLPSGLVKVAFDPAAGQSWPNVRAARLQLTDGTGAPQWNALLRVLTVPVPRGERREVRLSSYLNNADLALLGHLGWLADSGASASTVAAVRADTAAGQCWQITPYRPLTLVNAVRVPVTAPVLNAVAFVDADEPREPGSHRQDLAVTATVHRPSTGTLTMTASWTDPLDDPLEQPAGPENRVRRAIPQVLAAEGRPLPELTVGYDPDPATGAQVRFTATQGFGDTRRRVVSYSLTGTTRYMEFFTQRGRVVLRGTTPTQVARAGIAAGTDVVRSLDGTLTYRRTIDYTVDEAQGTIARIATGAIPNNGTVEVALVALPVSRPSSGQPLVVDLPSTARPLPPKPAWIVPTFGWTESSANLGRTRTRTRSGGGLRVFLERGWYSSGAGEQLAVVLADGSVAGDDEQLRTIVTRRAADPVTARTATPAEFPTAAEFTLARARVSGIVPAELPERTVSVAAHDVVFDTERKRWACDIVLPTGSHHQPFVSLVLARYQPNSLDGLHLSPVAQVEWVQLAPDRTATAVTELLDLTKVTLTVAGRSPSGTDAAPGQPNAMSVLVQSASGLNPGDLDWTVVGPADGQRLTASAQPGGTTLWTGTLRLPTSRLLRAYRLVIVEQEQHAGGGRLVYSDVIRL